MIRIIPVLAMSIFIGCGQSQPPELENATVTVSGTSNAEFYLSAKRIQRRVDGKESATIATNNYGKRALDENGKFEMRCDSDHGLDVVLVALDDEPLTLVVNADNLPEQTEEVAGQLKFTNIKFGWTDPDWASDTKDSLYEAKKLINNENADE